MADLRIADAPEIPTEDITGEEKLPTGGSGNYSITLDSLAEYTKTKKDLADNTSVDTKVGGVSQELNTHIGDLLNPHQVTKGQIGLGNVNNTADADKPVSNSTQAAIISAVTPKADKTYVDIGLSSKAEKTYVDNQLTLKANKADVYTKLETYTKQESSDLVNNSVSTALNPVNASLDLAKRGVANRYDHSLTYNSDERIVLTNGDIVKSTIDGNANNPNVDMTGWGFDDNTVESIADLIAIQNPKDGQAVRVKGYHRTVNFALAIPFRGGGWFIYDSRLSAINDGGTIINGWVRSCDKINVDDFGAKGDAVTNDSVAIQNGSNYCAKNHLELHFSDLSYVCESEISIDGDATAFRTIRWKGTFSSTGVNGKYGWWIGRSGTTIITKGNSLLNVWFRRFFNENISIDGIAIVNDSAAFPTTLAPYAIKLIKGDFVGFPSEFRYITGNKFSNFVTVGFTAGVLFRGNYNKLQAGQSYLSNYIGNTTFEHFYPYECGSGIVVENATTNRLRVSNSMFFSNSSGAIIKREAIDLTPEQRTEMLIMCQLDMVHFEDCRGLFRFFGQNPANEFKNYIVMNDVTREFCGLYDATTGNPYGVVDYTNVIVSGRHDQYGEINLPVLGVGSSITSQIEMSASLIGSGAKSLSHDKINLTSGSYTLESGGASLIVALKCSDGLGFNFEVETDVIINGGELGFKTFKSLGKTQIGSVGRFHSEQGAIDARITVSVNTANGDMMQEFIVANTTGATVTVDIVMRKNITGVQCYLI